MAEIQTIIQDMYMDSEAIRTRTKNKNKNSIKNKNKNKNRYKAKNTEINKS